MREINEYAVFDENGEFAGWSSSTSVPKGHTTKPAPKGCDLQLTTWDKEAKRWTINAELAKSQDHQKASNQLKDKNAVTGDWKPIVYAAKMDEIMRFTPLDWAERKAVKEDDFPFLVADAEAHGDTVEDAFKRFTAGAKKSLKKLAKIEAELQKKKLEYL